MASDVQPSFKYLLTNRERHAETVLRAIYKKRYRVRAESNPNLFLYLGDNPDRRTWSACSGRLPTLRMAGGLVWNVTQKRWLTGREKLASLGFPVTPETSSAMGVPPLPVKDVKRAGAIAGNAMCFATVGVVQLIALACYKKLN